MTFTDWIQLFFNPFLPHTFNLLAFVVRVFIAFYSLAAVVALRGGRS